MVQDYQVRRDIEQVHFTESNDFDQYYTNVQLLVGLHEINCMIVVS